MIKVFVEERHALIIQELKENNLLYPEIIEMLLIFVSTKKEHCGREDNEFYKMIDFLNI